MTCYEMKKDITNIVVGKRGEQGNTRSPLSLRRAVKRKKVIEVAGGIIKSG